MKPRLTLNIFALAMLCLIRVPAAQAVDDYKLGPDSMPLADAPKGKIEKFSFDDSKIFPGTRRDCWIYVPAQYDSSRAVCLMVFQDGGGYQDSKGSFRVPVVFDNLISKKEMPVTIAVFINPGNIPGTEPGQGGRSNRSYEYDSVSDLYVRFLVEEFLPPIESKYNITKDPAGRAICGISSGGICAFTAAWDRPDVFGKIVSHIGSYTNIRGGYVYPALIRKSKDKPKPLRVFLQDGANDLDNLHGSWPLAAQDMAAALKYAGYDYKFEFGDGKHSGKHGGAIFPDTMRWLWRDYPK